MSRKPILVLCITLCCLVPASAGAPFATKNSGTSAMGTMPPPPIEAIRATLGGIVVVDFDNLPAMSPVFYEGRFVPPEFVVSDAFLPLGVLFDSAGGGIYVAAPSNPVSPPNSVGATREGPVITYREPVGASFWLDGRAVVDFVSVTLTNSSRPSALEAYDIDGGFLGQDAGEGTLTVSFPGQIHSVLIQQGPMAFDNFTFGGLASTGGDCEEGQASICHIPPGNPANAHTISVACRALDAHMAHGDSLGTCY